MCLEDRAARMYRYIKFHRTHAQHLETLRFFITHLSLGTQKYLSIQKQDMCFT